MEPQIGRDTWVAEHAERLERRGLRGEIRRRYSHVPPPLALAALIVPAAFLPLAESDYIVRVGVNTLIFALLALGLNVVVGFAGLLDLGYIAFYGFGAYSYALLSSDQLGVHWPAVVSVPLIVVGSALLGLLLGLPSRRLLGDYLAIVTLFFGTIFVVLVTNANRITPPWREAPVDLTGGPNGIAGIDNFDVIAFEVTTVRGYFYLALVLFILVLSALYLLNYSRTGRAWRALREDPLAAQLMGMPINRLKLLAFAFGAAVAGLTGTIFAPLQNGVFPTNFDLALLITIYAMVILGGAGSLGGVVMGAITINVALEILRTPDQARMVFYALLVAGLFAWLRPRWAAPVVLAATVGFGYAVHAIVTTSWPSGTRGERPDSGWLGDAVDGWTVLLSEPRDIGNATYGGLLVAVIAMTLLRGRWRLVGLVPVLYLASVTWENRLVSEPSIARLILLGALLVALMNVRPQGLLGTARVEVA
jgi:branched-chain amino acid transport system permease protein